MKIVLLVCLALAAALADPRVSYEGYKTYRLTPRNAEEVKTLRALSDHPQFDFWSQPRVPNRPVDVMVAPGAQGNLESLLKELSIEYTVLMENVEAVFEAERREQEVQGRDKTGKISFTQYARYDEITDYIKELANSKPELATYKVIGQTHEGRDIGALIISSGGDGKRPLLFFEAGIHAREWIAPAVALYVINQLVEEGVNRTLLDQVDLAVVPITNPDGYEYSHTNERMWRKNRFPGNAVCKGVDANRNFGYKWGGEGASPQPCSETYRGKEAFSEQESQAIRSLALDVKDRTKLYVALHSVGPYFLYPWGYQWELPDDWRDLDNLAQDFVAATKNKDYEIGSSTQLLYEAAGGSDDWFKGGNDVKYAYTCELPGGGSQGFDPPPRLILPIVTETFPGILSLMANIAKLYPAGK